jgi:transcriptional regulator of stress and heat shock response
VRFKECVKCQALTKTKGSDWKMKLSDAIADMILNMFDENTPTIQIQRNDLAQQLGCVPSQINYVITSRFTPEQGYRIESRRGGGGYIMITRAATKENAIMSLVNSVGNSIDEKSAKANVYNLHYQGLISDKAGRIMMSVLSDSNFKGIETDVKNQIRASLLKQMLLAYVD